MRLALFRRLLLISGLPLRLAGTVLRPRKTICTLHLHPVTRRTLCCVLDENAQRSRDLHPRQVTLISQGDSKRLSKTNPPYEPTNSQSLVSMYDAPVPRTHGVLVFFTFSCLCHSLFLCFRYLQSSTLLDGSARTVQPIWRIGSNLIKKKSGEAFFVVISTAD